MSKKRGDLLIDSDDLLIVQTELATIIGLNEAIALQQIHYWTEINRKADKRDHLRDGKWWVYNTWTEWRERNFPFWGKNTIRRAFDSLEKSKLVTRQPHDNPQDGTWVAIDYAAVKKVIGGAAQNGQGGLPKMGRGAAQNGHSTSTTETTETTSTLTSPNGDVSPTAQKPDVPPRGTSGKKPKVAKAWDDVPHKTRAAVIDAWWSNLNVKPTYSTSVYNMPINHEMAAALCRNGYTAEDVKRYVVAMMDDDYWKDKTLTLSKVGELMPAWLKTHPTVTVVQSVRKPAEAELMGQLLA